MNISTEHPSSIPVLGISMCRLLRSMRPLSFCSTDKGENMHTMLQRGKKLCVGAGLLSVEGMVTDDNGHKRHFQKTADGNFDMQDLDKRADDFSVFLKEAGDHYGFDPGKSIAVGYSNGSNMLKHVMLRHPNLFSGVALWRTILPYAAKSEPGLEGKHVLLSVGTTDKMVMKDSPVIEALLRNARARVQVVFQEGGHGVKSGDLEKTAEWIRNIVRKPETGVS